MRKIARVTVAVSLLIAFAACSDSLRNIHDAKLQARPGVTIAQVTAALKRAGGQHGWRMKEIAPGEMEAHLDRGKHAVKVTITYNTKTYSINYKDSMGLGYNGVRIHWKYNDWIKNLRMAIEKETRRL